MEWNQFEELVVDCLEEARRVFVIKILPTPIKVGQFVVAKVFFQPLFLQLLQHRCLGQERYGYQPKKVQIFQDSV
jgi:hypothetical protein